MWLECKLISYLFYYNVIGSDFLRVMFLVEIFVL